MENNFDLTSFLKKNVLLRENIGGYRDITPLKEEDLEEGIDDDSEDPFPSIHKGDSRIFDKGWQYDDDEEDFEDDFPDEREMFLGQGGQEILDNIKYLIDNGFQLEDIVKQIQQHANYFQGEINELGNSGYDSLAANWEWNKEEAEESERLYKAARAKEAAEKAEKDKAQGVSDDIKEDDDYDEEDSIDSYSNDTLADYYHNAEESVISVATNLDELLNNLNLPKDQHENLIRLITDLGDAYAENRLGDAQRDNF